MALLPGHIQYSPVFVWLFSFLVFLLTSGKCRMAYFPVVAKACHADCLVKRSCVFRSILGKMIKAIFGTIQPVYFT